MKTTASLLQEKYGPLMTLEALAETLDRSSQGLRVSLLTKSDLSTTLNLTKRKIGRRVYFRTEGIAKIIDGEGVGNE